MIKLNNGPTSSAVQAPNTTSITTATSALQQLSNSSASKQSSGITTPSSNSYHQYINPQLAPRFLALNQFNQQSSGQAQARSTQQQFNTFTSNLSQQKPTNTQTLLSLSQPPQPSSSSNPLQQLLAARNICLNTLGQQQATSPLNTTTTSSLIASLAAATNSTFAQALPQGTLNNTLFVGNLHASLQEIDLIQVFRPFGRIVECCKKWLHFGFVKFSTEEEACHAYITLNGFRLKGRPMRLEFQNRSKKARIKAILAQAALQAAKNDEQQELFGSPLNVLLNSTNTNRYMGLNNQDQYSFSKMPEPMKQTQQQHSSEQLSFFDTEKLLRFANGYELKEEDKLPSYVEMAWNSIDIKSNSEQTTENVASSRWMMMDDLCLNMSHTNITSSANSPSNDDFSTSSSSCISDSGCRSGNSFYADEDSAIHSFKPSFTKISSVFDSHVNDLNGEQSISEHLEFTYSHTTHTDSVLKEKKKLANAQQQKASKAKIVEDEDEETNFEEDDDAKSYVSSSDTSDDASVIHEEDDDIDELSVTYSDENNMKFCGDDDLPSQAEINSKLRPTIEEIEQSKSKLEFGIYSCINETKSFFIEPEDVLKPLEDFKEYRLFPMSETNSRIEPYSSFFF